MADRRLGIWVAGLLLAGAGQPPLSTEDAADSAGNRMVAFPAIGGPPPDDAEETPRRHCAAARTWCAELRREEAGGAWRLELSEAVGQPRRIALAGDPDSDSFAIWPQLVREAGGAVLIGVERVYRTGFSGGGASRTALVLVRAEPGRGSPAVVLDIPLSGSAMVRACFAERDQRDRAGACHDEYALVGSMRLDPATRQGRPRFILTAAARTYPGRVSRIEDVPAPARLRRSDLVWARDSACSYRRILSYDAVSGRYEPDRPIPDCPDYFDF